MFGLLKSVTDLVMDVAEVVTAPVEMAVDIADAGLQPFKEAAESLKADIKSLKD